MQTGLKHHMDGTGYPERPQSPSNGIRRLIDFRRNQPKLQILDLGPPKRSKIDLLSTFAPCRIHVRDLNILPRSMLNADADGIGPDYTKELVFDPTIRFDLVFAWDMLNYLDRRQLNQLMTHVGGYCRDGALLYALVATADDIPSRPNQFEIQNNNRIVFTYPHGGNSNTINGPNYQPTEFQSLLPRFRVMHMYQLPNRYQEHLYSFDPVKQPRNLRFA